MNHTGMNRLLLLFSAFLASSVSAELVQFEAVYEIDSKTTFNPSDTVIISGSDFDAVQLGDRYTVHFIIETDLTDMSDVIDVTDNALLASDARIGNFGAVVESLSLEASPGNSGTFDPTGAGFSSSTASSTSDAQAVYKSNAAVANKEVIRVLVAASPVPAILGGELTDVILNFNNVQPLGASNPEDYLDDRSLTIDPFDFNALFSGPSQVAGNVRDLVLFDDDILGTGFAVSDLNRPLNLRFGEADVLPAVGPSFQRSIYASGTLISLSLPPAPTLIPPLVPGLTPIATPIATPSVPPSALPTSVPLPFALSALLALAISGMAARRLKSAH